MKTSRSTSVDSTYDGSGNIPIASPTEKSAANGMDFDFFLGGQTSEADDSVPSMTRVPDILGLGQSDNSSSARDTVDLIADFDEATDVKGGNDVSTSIATDNSHKVQDIVDRLPNMEFMLAGTLQIMDDINASRVEDSSILGPTGKQSLKSLLVSERSNENLFGQFLQTGNESLSYRGAIGSGAIGDNDPNSDMFDYATMNTGENSYNVFQSSLPNSSKVDDEDDFGDFS